MAKITKETLVGEVVFNAKDPDAVANVFYSYGMSCLCCPSARNESIEQAAAVHDIPLEELLAALNKVEGE